MPEIITAIAILLLALAVCRVAILLSDIAQSLHEIAGSAEGSLTMTARLAEAELPVLTAAVTDLAVAWEETLRPEIAGEN